MLKMQKEKKNSGMSLVEVIISMLVLSIAVVTVMSAFSMASKTNLQSKQHQCVESLMENFVEYAEAGGKDFRGYFNVDIADYMEAVSGDVKTETLKSLRQGYFHFDVEVVTNNAPDEYKTAELNDRPIIQFGGTGSNTILIDASLNRNDNDSNGICDSDDAAYDYFYTWHTIEIDNRLAKVDVDLAEETITEAEANNKRDEINSKKLSSLDSIYNFVDRELWFTTVETVPGKMKLQAYFRYELDNSDVIIPSGVDEKYTRLIYSSNEYNKAAGGDGELDQVYVLYSSATKDPDSTNMDIRILDHEEDDKKKLDASIYLVYQDPSVSEIDAIADTVFTESLSDRANRVFATSPQKINVSFKNPDSSKVETPKKVKIYSYTNIELNDDDSNVEFKPEYKNSIVSRDNEVRIVTVTIKVLEQGTGKVLSTKEITRLQ